MVDLSSSSYTLMGHDLSNPDHSKIRGIVIDSNIEVMMGKSLIINGSSISGFYEFLHQTSTLILQTEYFLALALIMLSGHHRI